jgi:preprotein translocase subunit SecE
MGSLQTYVQESYNELINKVTWPTFRNLQSDTVVVIVATILLSLLIFGMDAISNFVLDLVYSLNIG